MNLNCNTFNLIYLISNLACIALIFIQTNRPIKCDCTVACLRPACACMLIYNWPLHYALVLCIVQQFI